MVRYIPRPLLATIGLFVLQACEQEPTGSLVPADEPVTLHDSEKELSLDLCTTPDPDDFTIASTNPYFPIDVGYQWDYEGVEDGEAIRLLITVLNETRVVDGVTTRVIEEREWVDDELLEVSWNYFANAPDGTTCYFGEDVDIFEDDNILHDGAWCADVYGPGIIMPADPEPGMTYKNEDVPGIAEDTAKIVGTQSVTVGGVTYTETIRVEESTPLEKGKGYKVFAAGTGLIIDGPVELVSFIQGAKAPKGPTPSARPLCGQ